MTLENHVIKSIRKLERSLEIGQEIFNLCEQYVLTEDRNLLASAEVRLADFINNIRSPMNYIARDIFERHLLPNVEKKERNNLQQNLDFPWRDTKKDFDNLRVIKAIRKVGNDLEPLYHALEQVQPYHPNYDWLARFMRLSNRDKHKITNEVQSQNAIVPIALRRDGREILLPQFSNEKIYNFSETGVIEASLPYYYPLLGAFATPQKTWSFFWIPYEPKLKVNLIEFLKETPEKVLIITSNLYRKFGQRDNESED